MRNKYFIGRWIPRFYTFAINQITIQLQNKNICGNFIMDWKIVAKINEIISAKKITMLEKKREKNENVWNVRTEQKNNAKNFVSPEMNTKK